MESTRGISIAALAPETLANVLRFLPARHLVNSLLVCRLWKQLAERELSQRKFFVSRVFKCRKDKPTSLDDADDFREQVLEFLNVIDIVPSAVLMSCCKIFSELPLGQFRKTFISKFTANLPKNCVVVGARGVGGVIGETDFGCPMAENDFIPQLSLLFVPKAKGVNVDLFQMTGKEIEGSSMAQWRSKLDHLVNKDIKCLFLIGGNTMSTDYIDKIWARTDTILGPQIVFAGGLATPFAVVNKKTTYHVVMGLAFGGKLKAANAVYHMLNPRKEVDIRELLRKFSLVNESRAKHDTACIVTPCVSLKRPLFDVETSRQFRKEFPLMKVFGFFGLGEIGMKLPQWRDDTEQSTNVAEINACTISLSVLKLL
mgnify:CR=1 FL=1